MKRERPGRFVFATIVAATSLASAAACVDLFHATDFPTLCSEDASACRLESGADGPEEAPEAAAPIDLCAATTAARGKAEHACAFLGACLGSTADDTFGRCMIEALAAFDCAYNPRLRPLGKTAALWDCLANAGSCDDVETCVFGGQAPPCEGSGYTACNSTNDAVAVVECGSTGAVAINPCILHGQTCGHVDDSVSLCVGEGGVSCEDFTPHCNGTAAVRCHTVSAIRSDDGLDCAAYGGGRCVEDGAGVACAPTSDAKPCEGDSKVVCYQGKIAQSCVGKKLVTFDCSAIGLICDDSIATTLDPSSACTSPDADAGACPTLEDTCTDAGALRGCARNMLFETQCTKLGLGACGAKNGRRPACSPPGK